MKAVVTLLDVDGDHVGQAELDYERRMVEWDVPEPPSKRARGRHPARSLVIGAVVMPDGARLPMAVPKQVWPGDHVCVVINVAGR